jgi:hypothetical protein
MRFVPSMTAIFWLTLLLVCARAQRPSTTPSTRTVQPAAKTTPIAGDAPRVTFRRLFKSSTPELIEITVPEGSEPATYEIRQLDDDPGSNPFEISDALRNKIFSLAGELHHFQGQDLDVHRKIANLGEKTFRWQQGAIVYETKFNYTLNAPATQLLQIFEGLARQQEHLELLTRRMKYDRLGINDALMECDTDFSRGLLPEPQTLLPVLDQIAADGHVVDIARQRARTLAERIRHPKA